MKNLKIEYTNYLKFRRLRNLYKHIIKIQISEVDFIIFFVTQRTY